MANLRGVMKNRGLGLKDSSRHAKHLLRANHDEFHRNFKGINVWGEAYSDRVIRDEQLGYSQTDVLYRKARADPDKVHSASMMYTDSGKVTGHVAKDTKTGKMIEVGLTQQGRYPFGSRRRSHLKQNMGKVPAGEKGDFRDQIKSLPKGKEKAVESTGKAAPKKKCIKDRLKKAIKCFTA